MIGEVAFLQIVSPAGVKKRPEEKLRKGTRPGRVQKALRTLPTGSPTARDVTEAVVDFSQRCYGDRVEVIQSRLAPPLQYETEFFDYVYANSVFTHIQTDVHDAWIAEMARIGRPGGIVTVFNSDQALPHVDERDFDRMHRTTGHLEWGSSHVRENCLYAIPAKLEKWWGKHFTVLELRRHFKLQDQLVLRKP